MTNLRAAIVKALALYAYQYKLGGFTLTSGAVSDDYLDCKQMLCRAGPLWLVGKWLCSDGVLLPEVTAIGGLTMGADPIAIACSLTPTPNPPRFWFSVRKEPKSHGSKRLIEGAVVPGAHVCVVDDVCTTGVSTIRAIRACRAEGLIVAQVIVLVDREEQDGMANIQRELGELVSIQALTTKSEVRAAWQELQEERLVNGYGVV